jgi:hypothetical protein
VTTSLALQTGFALLVASLGLGLGCNGITGASDLTIGEGAGGAGGANVTTGGLPSGAGGATAGATTGGNTAAATSTGAGGAPGSSSNAASSTAAGTSAASSTAASTSAATTGGGTTDVAQTCVDDINAFRATLGLPPYARWTPEEACAGDEAAKDAAANQAHSAFGQCGEWAQDECPGWPGPPGSMIGNCLQMMWDEGPGDFNQGHGHYINMSSTSYTMVACGFHVLGDGKVWATQDFK